MASRLKELYDTKIRAELKKQLGYKNDMQLPKLEKIVINIGLGDVKENPKSLDNAIAELAMITGQKPIVTKAKKSIADPLICPVNNNLKFFIILNCSNHTIFRIRYAIQP